MINVHHATVSSIISATVATRINLDQAITFLIIAAALHAQMDIMQIQLTTVVRCALSLVLHAPQLPTVHHVSMAPIN